MDSIRSSAAAIDVRQLGTVEYRTAWQLQRDLADARVAGGSDTLLLLRAPAGLHRRTAHRAARTTVDGTPVVDTDRGGKITWHGPGQLVGYPIIGLGEPLDVVNYVRRLEESLIKVCGDLGLDTGRVDGRSGVWVPAGPAGPHARSPLSGCGCRARPHCTGSRSTATATWTRSRTIVPCGITDAGVTSLSAELGRTVAVDEVRAAVADGGLRRPGRRLAGAGRTHAGARVASAM